MDNKNLENKDSDSDDNNNNNLENNVFDYDSEDCEYNYSKKKINNPVSTNFLKKYKNPEEVEDFVLEKFIEKYNNSEEINIKNKIENCNILQEIFNVIDFNKINNLKCEFIYKKFTDLQITITNNFVLLTINSYKENNLKELLLNLPNEINKIFINHSMFTELTDCFVNLPINVTEIIISFSSKSKELINNEYGDLNFLFNTKLPFGCKIELLFQNIYYTVNYENDEENTITLINNLNEKIIIKYVKKEISIPQNYNVLRIMSGLGGLAYSS